VPDVKRRPIADFLIMARERPNVALGWGLAVVALLAVVGFGISEASGGSSKSSAGAGANAGGPDQISPLDNGVPGDGGSGGSAGSGGSGGSSSSGHSGGSGTATNTTSAGHNGGSSGGGSKTHDSSGGNTQPTFPRNPTITTRPTLVALPKSAQKWVASPSNIHMKAGAGSRGYVVVLNLSDTYGTVPSPGCSSPPMATPPTGPLSGTGPTCHPGSPTVLLPHRSQRFTWTWHATQTGRAGAPPLAPGSYFFAIGPVSVHVTVK
jgi:hypothetical protein